mmetsp:Transcript_51056/g.103803  ORF Transcript_51056/g.103803 Transcript_51056/m.103803 type:complete len:758 (+) Transcript_51056:175-2448(+)
MSTAVKLPGVQIAPPTILRKSNSGGFEQRMARGPDDSRGFKGAGRGGGCSRESTSPPVHYTQNGRMPGAQANPGSQISPQFSFAQATAAKKPSPTQVAVDVCQQPTNPPDISLNSFASMTAESPITDAKISARARAAEEASRKQRQLEAAARAQESSYLSGQPSPLSSPAPSPARSAAHHPLAPPAMTPSKEQKPIPPGIQTGGVRSSPAGRALGSPATKPQVASQSVIWVGGNPVLHQPPLNSPGQRGVLDRSGKTPPSPVPAMPSTTPPAEPDQPAEAQPAASHKPVEAVPDAWGKPRGAKRALEIGGIPAQSSDSSACKEGSASSPEMKPANSTEQVVQQDQAKQQNDGLDWEVCMAQLGQSSAIDGNVGSYLGDDVSPEERERARQQVLQFLLSNQQKSAEGHPGATFGSSAAEEDPRDADVPDSWEMSSAWEKETATFTAKEEAPRPKASVWGSADKSPKQGVLPGLYTPEALSGGADIGKGMECMELGDGFMPRQGAIPSDFDLTCEEENNQRSQGSPCEDSWERLSIEEESKEKAAEDSKEPQSASDALKNLLGIGMLGGGSVWGAGTSAEPQAPAKKLPVWGKPDGGLDISMDPAIAQISKSKPQDQQQQVQEPAASPPDPETLVQKECNPNPTSENAWARRQQQRDREQQNQMEQQQQLQQLQQQQQQLKALQQHARLSAQQQQQRGPQQSAGGPQALSPQQHQMLMSQQKRAMNMQGKQQGALPPSALAYRPVSLWPHGPAWSGEEV